MNIITPVVEKPALTLEFTGEEAEKFMDFLYYKEPSNGFLADGLTLYTSLYNKGYRRSRDNS